MREADFRYLIGPEGRARLEQLTPEDISPAAYLGTASRLRDEVGSEATHALLETVDLRQRAAVKFSRADGMLFTREALEQSTGEVVAAYRAAQFARRGFSLVADLGCGIGGDAIALAESAEVVGVERDPLRLMLTRHNMSVYGREGRFMPVCADLMELSPFDVDAFFIDPARRTPNDTHGPRSHRLKSIHDYQPPWSTVEAWLARAHAAMKVSPGIDYAELPPGAALEFVSLHGEVKEGIFWFGDLRPNALRKATLLPEGLSLATAGEEPGIEVSAPLAFLYEPDGAVIRAHLVRTLAANLDAKLIDSSIAYLTSDRYQPSPLPEATALSGVSLSVKAFTPVSART
ncbi:MAG: SAM-dependent methyltransferase [Chloroflexota bacterium]